MSDQNHLEHPVLADVYKICTEIEETEARLKLARQQLHEAVLELPSKIGDNEDLRDEIVHHLYWFDERVPANTLKKAFHVVCPSSASKKNPQQNLRSAYVEVDCRECQRPCQIEIKSRSALPLRPYTNICDECHAKRDQAYRKDYQMQQKEVARRTDILSTMPYYDYLQTPEWQERRKRAMKRAGFRCQVCNAYGVRLNVHHRTYERRGHEQDRDLLTLCQECHGIFHENGKLAKEVQE